MTINKVANQEDVLTRSGLMGFESMLTYNGDPHLKTNVSGDGKVSYDFYGAGIAAGGTTGDTASLKGLYGSRADQLSTLYTTMVYHLTSGDAPLNDKVKIGWAGRDISSNYGGFLDLKNGEYNVNGTTVPANTPNQNTAAALTVKIDFQNNETTFLQQGGVNEQKTISKTSSPRNGIVHTESTGADDSNIKIYYVRQAIQTGDML